MTLLVPIMLFGWVPLTIAFFLTLRPHIAVLCAVIGGFLFLPPSVSYNIPGIPEYSKETSIALGILLGGIISRHRWNSNFRWQIYDLPMAVWCFASPIATSLINGLGLYDGFSGMMNTYISWGIFYWAGRIYFNEPSSLRDLCMGIIIGGLIYVPLCLFELRMSPQLSKIFYGFHPHAFIQHIRFGGYRPMVFMQHGLMVALWMAQATIIAYWFWRTKIIRHIKTLPMIMVFIILFFTAVLCKSINAWFFLMVGMLSCFYFKKSQSNKLFQLMFLLIPIYMVSRITGLISAETIQEAVKLFPLPIDEARIRSLTSRLLQEDLFSAKAMLRPFFGWGGWQRGWPIDPETGDLLVRIVDAFWTITLNTRGFVGLVSVFLAMLIGPWLVFKNFKDLNKIETENRNTFIVEAIILSLLIVFFMIDCLMNGMINPVYILCSGALVTYHISFKKRSLFSKF